MTIGAATKHAAEAGGRFFWHAAAVVVGLVLMVVGLALGVTMIMLPAGLVIGLLGVGILVTGLFARANTK